MCTPITFNALQVLKIDAIKTKNLKGFVFKGPVPKSRALYQQKAVMQKAANVCASQ